ncbi:hypothetical protein LOS21_13355 [Enterococcus faecium]|nr:hypothetical protein [Enterococcus faecium]
MYELWYESYKTTVKEVTQLKIEIKFNKWILPKYGKFRIKEITVKHVQKILNQWAKMTDQYKVLHSTVSRIFKYAMTLGLITKNPCELVIMPNRNVEKKERYCQNLFTESTRNSLPILGIKKKYL